MFLKESYRRYEKYRFRKKRGSSLDSVSTCSVSTCSSADERPSQYLDLRKVQKIQAQLDELSAQITKLQAEIITLQEDNEEPSQQTLHSLLIKAFENERNEMSEQELGQPFSVGRS